MSFKIASKEEGIKWPVVINQPSSGGAVKQHKVHVYFIVKGKEQVDDLVDQGDFDFMRQVIDAEKGWEGFKQESDEVDAPDVEVEYSEETLKEYLEVPYISIAFIDAYFNFIRGVSSKNSKRLR